MEGEEMAETEEEGSDGYEVKFDAPPPPRRSTRARRRRGRAPAATVWRWPCAPWNDRTVGGYTDTHCHLSATLEMMQEEVPSPWGLQADGRTETRRLLDPEGAHRPVRPPGDRLAKAMVYTEWPEGFRYRRAPARRDGAHGRGPRRLDLPRNGPETHQRQRGCSRGSSRAPSASEGPRAAGAHVPRAPLHGVVPAARRTSGGLVLSGGLLLERMPWRPKNIYRRTKRTRPGSATRKRFDFLAQRRGSLHRRAGGRLVQRGATTTDVDEMVEITRRDAQQVYSIEM